MKIKTIQVPFLISPDDPDGVLIPDVSQIQIAISGYKEEFANEKGARSGDLEVLIKSLETRKTKLVNFITCAREQGRIKDIEYTLHQYTTNERIEARSEASTIVDGQIQFEEPIYRRELVRRVVKDIGDPGRLSAPLVDRLYFEAIRLSEPSDEEIFFIAGLGQTSEKETRSKKGSQG